MSKEVEDFGNKPKDMWDWYIAAFYGLIGLYNKLNNDAMAPMSEDQKKSWRDSLKQLNEWAN